MKCIKGFTKKREKFNRPGKIGTGHEYDPIHESMAVLFLSFSFPTYSKIRNGGGRVHKVNACIFINKTNTLIVRTNKTPLYGTFFRPYELINTGLLGNNTGR